MLKYTSLIKTQIKKSLLQSPKTLQKNQSLRRPHFHPFSTSTSINPEKLTTLTNYLKSNSIRFETEDVDKYQSDWTGMFSMKPPIVLLPRNTHEVQKIIQWCNQHSITSDDQGTLICLSIITPESTKINVFGGGTSLVGGSTATSDTQICLSLERLTDFEMVDQKTGQVVCGAGIILQNLNDDMEKFQLVTPYNLGAKGSCTIGGNVATLAGGINFVFFGSLRSYVQGLKVVTGHGQILDLMRWNVKDNTGLDLKQFFIGSEGQLGIITEVGLALQPLKPFSETCFLRVKGFAKVLEFLFESKSAFGNKLYSVEYLDFESYNISVEQNNFQYLLEHDPKFSSSEDYRTQCYKDNAPIDDELRDYFLLIEIVGDSQEELTNALYEFIDAHSENLADGMICEGDNQRRALWEIRESVVLGVKKFGGVLKYDVSLDPKRFQDLVDHVRREAGGMQKFVSGYGHIGDGNIHLNVCVADRLMGQGMLGYF